MGNIKIIAATKSKPNTSNINKKEIKRVCAYARVSTEKDEQFSSYEAQKDYYYRYITNNPNWLFVSIYTDEGITGTSTKNRTGFKQMLTDAINNKIDLIITKSVSRFARNTVDSLTAIRLLKENNVEVFFEKENIWTFDTKGELLITIMSSLAQEESHSISDNVTWGIKESMRKGHAYVPYKAFLGYDKGENGEMIINEEEAKLVKYIYALAITNFSPFHITKILEERKIKTKTNSYTWHSSTILSILTNEKYKGDALRQKTYTSDYLTKKKIKNKGEVEQFYIEDHHKPIIDKDIFNRLNEDIKRKKENKEKHGRNYTLSKRVKCGCCGSSFGLCYYGRTKRKRKLYWRCNQKYDDINKERCTTPNLSEKEIKDLFVNKFNAYLINYKDEVINNLINIFNDIFDINSLLINIDKYKNELNIIKYQLQRKKYKDNIDINNRYNELKALINTNKESIKEYKKRNNKINDFLLNLLDSNIIFNIFDENIWYTLTENITIYDKDTINITLKDGEIIK